MRLTAASISLALAALVSATQSNDTSAPLNAVPSSWDGHCYYPKPDIGFQLESYLGKWYQVAGTVAPFTAGCKCIQAQYELNVRKKSHLVQSQHHRRVN
jgi:apolipoprotein D and lipocalin family protein